MQRSSTVLRFFIDNFGWMVASLLLAIIVWYAATSAQNPVEQQRLPNRVPIQMLTDDGVMIVDTVVDTAQVTIRAPHSVFDVLQTEDINVVADLTRLQPGKTYTVPLKASLSNARRGVITDIQPSQITVPLARRIEQLVNVNAVQIADPPPGFTASETPSVPAAKVIGPETSVKRVVAAQARISLLDQRTGFTRVVPLVAVDSDNKEVTDVTLDPTQVTLTVDVQPRPGSTEVSVVPNLSGTLPQGYFRRNYSWDPKSVLVRGDRTTIDNMNGFVSTEPIDLTGKTQTFTQKVKLALPPGVTTTDTVDVTVTVEIDPVLVSREFDGIPVQTQGLDVADYSITVHPDRVNVIVNGPQSVLDALSPTDISVIAPLSGLSAGTSTVVLQASATRPEIRSEDIVIPNARVDVTIVALHPTATPTFCPTRIPTEVSTASATP